MVFRLWLFTLLCLMTTVTAQDLEDDEIGIISRTAIKCETRDEKPGYCLPVVRCRRIMSTIRRFQNPNICFFEGDLPHVCCPVKLKTDRVSTSSSSRPVRTTPSTRVTVNRPITRPTAATRRTTTTTRRPTTTTRRPTTATRRPTSERLTAVQLNPTGCGKRPVPSESTAFVVGGNESRKYSWPWMAGIRIRTFGENTRFLCGGSLITQRHILTAAHCFGEGGGNKPSSDFKVILGSHYRRNDFSENSPDDEEGVVTISPSAVRVHEDYRDNSHEHDVAIMILSADAPTGERIKPVCLPSRPNYNKDDGDVVVIGWGDLSFGGVGSKTLQEASFTIIPLNRCRRIFRRVPAFASGITSGMLCAGDLSGEKDACQHDSGGPLLEQDQVENKWTQVGIVSFGYQCAERGFPGVYARVAAYVPWIQRTIR